MNLRSLLPVLCLALNTKAQNSTDPGPRDNERPTATIGIGTLRGRTTKLADANSTVDQFLGIPFAQPPVGKLRFAAPQEPPALQEVYDATRQPKACMQLLGKPGPVRDLGRELFYDPPPPNGESEDCLYLNVYSPGNGMSDNPVLFWLYGGSGMFGAASQPIYDGSSFAAHHNIVVVIPNYRLSVFGTPSATGLPHGEGNPGILDQRLALDWARQNIAGFGGDPAKVTIMGESAGAMGVGNLINTYPDNAPFRAGVEMSGSTVYALSASPGAVPSGEWEQLLASLNCSSGSEVQQLECVREVDAEELISTLENNGLTFTQWVRDNITTLERPDVAWASGNVAKVPLMIGSTADDGSFFVASTLLAAGSSASNATHSSAAGLDTILSSALGLDEPTANMMATLYAPGSPIAEGANATEDILSQIATDYTFRCTSGLVANLTSTLLNVPVWQYVFDAKVPSNTIEGFPELGVYHASEIEILFGTYPRENTTQAEIELSRSMQKQFADFIRDPESGPGWAQWPQIGVLGVDGDGPTTSTESALERDAVCQYYHPLYLSSLPALLKMGNSNASNGSGAVGDGSAPLSQANLAAHSVRPFLLPLLCGLAGLLMV